MDDLSRLRQEYADRARRLSGRDIYSFFNLANLFAIHGRQRAVLKALQKYGKTHLSDLQIFEMGCGDGGVLSEFRWLGANPGKLFGVDLLADRVGTAHQNFPEFQLSQANGQFLPFHSDSFDLALQYTALSSILDPQLRYAICAEMMRVTRPNGLILSYDFWLNPTNRQTHGIRPVELRRLFPGCTIELNRITLAPPIARRLAEFSWSFCAMLEALKIFNTHYLAVIIPLAKDTK